MTVEALFIDGTVDVASASDDTFVEFANSSVVAFFVSDTLGRRWQNFDAVVFRVAGEVGQTAADSVVVPSSADGVESTRPVLFARVLARVADASLQETAVVVGSTSGYADGIFAKQTDGAVAVVQASSWFSDFFTVHLRIALESWRARADGMMISRLAKSVDSASVRQAADKLALAVDASPIVSAVVVVTASLWKTRKVFPMRSRSGQFCSRFAWNKLERVRTHRCIAGSRK